MQIMIRAILILFLNSILGLYTSAQDIASFVLEEKERKEKINKEYYSIFKDTLNYCSNVKIPKSSEIDTAIFCNFTEFEKKTRHFKYLHTIKDLVDIIDNWTQVSEYEWTYSYSHVANNDSYGIMKLNNGKIIRFMIRPGSLAYFTFSNNEKIYMAFDTH